MVAVLNDSETLAILDPGESRFMLHDISWATYESLLNDFADRSAPRLTYDRGDLEIMSPKARHEAVNDAVNLFVNLVCAELEIEARSLGSTTFKRHDAERGFEADSCFYFQNEALIRGKDEIELPRDPPPDLVFEVDITNSSLDKDSIFAQFGVPEVWRYSGRAFDILVLTGSSYRKMQASSVLPFVTAELLLSFISESLTISRVEWVKRVREWAREQKSQSGRD